MGVKPAAQKLHKPPTRFAVDITNSPHFYTSFLHTFRTSKWTFDLLQASYTLFRSQNRLSELFKHPTRFEWVKTDSPNFYKSFFTPCVREKWLSVLLQASYTLCGSQNRPPNMYKLPSVFALVKPPTRFTEVQTHSPMFYKPPTRFADVRTISLNFYKPPTCFAEVVIDFAIFCKPPTRFTEVKGTHRTSSSLPYTLCGSQNWFS